MKRRKSLKKYISLILILIMMTTIMVVTPYSNVMAATSTITVDAGVVLGNAAEIKDFLGAGGMLYTNVIDPNDPLVLAWQRLGLKYNELDDLAYDTNFQSAQRLINIINKDATPYMDIDFTRFDQYVNGNINNLGAQLVFYLGNVPRVLSSYPNTPPGDYIFSMLKPRDLGEWQRFVRTVVHHIKTTFESEIITKFGVDALTYAIPSEPDWSGYDPNMGVYVGNYSDGSISLNQSAQDRLNNFIEVWAATYRGLRQEDPNGHIYGGSTMTWKMPNFSLDFTLEDVLSALHNYIQLPVNSDILLDGICWQDYEWQRDASGNYIENISDAADYVSNLLSAYGFDPNTPKAYVGSGAGTWSANYGDTNLTPYYRGSYAAHNIIREFKRDSLYPNNRKFTTALHFLFADGDGNETSREAMVVIQSGGALYYTPIYAAFQIASDMAGRNEQDKIVSATPQDGGGLEVLATKSGQDCVKVAVNNHSPYATANDIDVVINNLPFGTTSGITGKLQIIDANHSNDGNGLEAGVGITPVINSSTATVHLGTLQPYSTSFITLSTSQSSTLSFVTGGTLSSTTRNDCDIKVGMQITTGNSPITVSELGRYYIQGNNGVHNLEIYNTASGTLMGSTSVDMASGSTESGYKYAALSTPVTLSANTSYYIVTNESNGGDMWYDGDSTLTATNDASIDGAVAANPDGTGWYMNYPGTGYCFGPVSFKYSLSTESSTPTVDDRDARITYSPSASWTQAPWTGDYNDTESYTNATGAYAQFTFTGTSINYISYKQESAGIIEVYLDGSSTPDATIDMYQSGIGTLQSIIYSKTWGTSGQHTIKLVCTGTKNASATNCYLVVDAFQYTN